MREAEAEKARAGEQAAAAQAAAEEAEADVDEAAKELADRDEAVSSAKAEVRAAEAEQAAAREEYDSALAGSMNAEAAAAEASRNREEADRKAAEENALLEQARAAAQAARDAFDSARDNAEKAVDGKIAEAQALAAKLGEDAAAAREALRDAQEQYKQGIMGMIDWMLGKEGLSKIQKQDLESARSILREASEEKITKWSGGADHPFPAEREDSVICIGDEKDATSLDNVRRAVEVMKKINELRAADDNYAGLRDKPATTNFHFLATAEAGAMRGAALMRHSRLTTSCEDLAFGYSDPTVGWYNEEKADFDAIKESLGITKITGLDDIRRIEREAEKRGIVVGHYTNLFWESDQIMGVGYTQYGKRFKNTFCYNAGKTSSYTNDEYGRGRHAYTVEEMEALLDSYCESIDRDRLSAAAEMAEQALLDAEKDAELLQAGREDAVSSLISEAGKALEQKES